jgi:hypothetical protein
MVQRKIVITLAALVLVFSSPALAGGGGQRPSILGARLFVAGGFLESDITSRGLFSDRVVRTIESGLPATVELFYAVVSGGGDASSRGAHIYELRYDVWEDFYSIAGFDSLRRFSSFDAMSAVIEHLRGVPIIPIERVKTDGAYTIRFSIAVRPLRGGEEREIAGWVGENVRGGTEDGWREQLLNLNDLIERFFARERDTAARSEWFETESFVPRLLPVRTEGAVTPVNGSSNVGEVFDGAVRSGTDRDAEVR